MFLIGSNFHKIMSLLDYCINILSFLHLKIKSNITFCMLPVRLGSPVFHLPSLNSSTVLKILHPKLQQFSVYVINLHQQATDVPGLCATVQSGNCKRLACSSFYSFQLIMDLEAFYMTVLFLFFQTKGVIFIPHFCIFYITAKNFTVFTYQTAHIKLKINFVSNTL